MAQARPQQGERQERPLPRRARSAWQALMLLRIVLLIFSIVLPPLAEGSGTEIPMATHVEMGLVSPAGHNHANATQGCHTASICVTQALLESFDMALQRVHLQQPFLFQDELMRPSRRLPVDLPPPRLSV